MEVVGWLGEQGRSGNAAGTFRLHGTELSRFIAEQGLIEFESDDHEFLEVTPVTIAGALTDERPDAPWVRDDTLGQTAMHVTKSPPGTRIAVLEDGTASRVQPYRYPDTAHGVGREGCPARVRVSAKLVGWRAGQD